MDTYRERLLKLDTTQLEELIRHQKRRVDIETRDLEIKREVLLEKTNASKGEIK